MKKFVFAIIAVCSVLLSTPSLAQNVKMTIQNASGATISKIDSACTSSTCPSNIPLSIAANATSIQFTAIAGSTQTSMMRVTYGSGNNACRFTAQTGKTMNSGGACLTPPVIQANKYSGSPTCTVFFSNQDNDSCDLTVIFKYQ